MNSVRGVTGCDNDDVSPTPAQQAQAARIAAELAALGFALPGTLADRMTRCGRANCRCHADPPRLHGPFHQWTRKKNGKTATRILTDDQLADYGPGSTTTAACANRLPNSKPSASPSPRPTPLEPLARPPGTARWPSVLAGLRAPFRIWHQSLATSADVPRRFGHVLQARGHWFEPSCAHQVGGHFRMPVLVTCSKRGAKRSH